MIPSAYITEWQNTAPWINDDQIEQDLIISRAILDIFKSDFLVQKVRLRGGTALNKLFFSDPVRYSEDIDLVQVVEEPIGQIADAIKYVIDPWLGKSTTQTRLNGFRIFYRFIPESDPQGTKRIKIEINTREHFSVYPIEEIKFKIESQWFNNKCILKTYSINELLGTKLRALYQRKKGRDLFDIYWAIKVCEGIDFNKIIKSFKTYLKNQNLTISKRDFILNLNDKMSDSTFIRDMDPLLRADIEYSPQAAYTQIKQLIELI